MSQDFRQKQLKQTLIVVENALFTPILDCESQQNRIELMTRPAGFLPSIPLPFLDHRSLADALPNIVRFAHLKTKNTSLSKGLEIILFCCN